MINMYEIRSVLQTPLLSEFIGKRVVITGKHPWSDSLGDIMSIERTLAGWGTPLPVDSPHRHDNPNYLQKHE